MATIAAPSNAVVTLSSKKFTLIRQAATLLNSGELQTPPGGVCNTEFNKVKTLRPDKSNRLFDLSASEVPKMNFFEA